MHYLVTGGAGFIGSNTVDELVRRGHSVTVLDDLSAGKEAKNPGEDRFHSRYHHRPRNH
jgi:nucleoside-diphosphate-sugar epimerase